MRKNIGQIEFQIVKPDSRPTKCAVWHVLKKLDFFTIQLIFTTIHKSYCIF